MTDLVSQSCRFSHSSDHQQPARLTDLRIGDDTTSSTQAVRTRSLRRLTQRQLPVRQRASSVRWPEVVPLKEERKPCEVLPRQPEARYEYDSDDVVEGVEGGEEDAQFAQDDKLKDRIGRLAAPRCRAMDAGNVCRVQRTVLSSLSFPMAQLSPRRDYRSGSGRSHTARQTGLRRITRVPVLFGQPFWKYSSCAQESAALTNTGFSNTRGRNEAYS